MLDANVLIDAERDYYPMDRVPEFWEWLLHQAMLDQVGVPVEVFDEIVQGQGSLVQWLKRNKEVLVLLSEIAPDAVRDVVDRGYATDLDEAELEQLGADPFLVAHALVGPDEVAVVTMESSRPSRVRANRHLPDVCRALNVSCINTFELVRRLNFNTSWRAGLTSGN